MKTAKEYAAMLRGPFDRMEIFADEAKAIAGMLELIEEHVADMEQKGRALSRMAKETESAIDRARLAGKAGVYIEEARRLRQILEGK
jgi:hypothetical protein